MLTDITTPMPGLKKANQVPTIALTSPIKTAITILMISPNGSLLNFFVNVATYWLELLYEISLLVSAPFGRIFIQREVDFFAQNPIGRFSNPKGRTAPKSIDFQGFREYTGSMND